MKAIIGLAGAVLLFGAIFAFMAGALALFELAGAVVLGFALMNVAV